MSEGEIKAFYNSKAWKLFRQKIILERGTKCEECGEMMFEEVFHEEGKRLYHNMQLHHTPIEITADNVKDVNVTLNPANVKLICFRCHNKAHGRYCGKTFKRKNKAVYIVYGPPMAGKDTYVETHRQQDDIIVNMDRIYQAISGRQMHDKPDELKYNVFKIRDALLEQIQKRYGRFNSAWIIGGYADQIERERLADRLGAECILIKPEKEVCIARLESCGGYRGSHKAEWKGYIEKWFDEFEE